MAEICIMIVNRVNDDPKVDAQCFKRGDVVEVLPDGSDWGSSVRKLSIFRIIKLPNVSVEEARAFLAPELPADPEAPKDMLQRRAFRLDLDNPIVPQALRDYLADDTRVKDSASFPATVDMIRSLKVAKEPLPEQAVAEATEVEEALVTK